MVHFLPVSPTGLLLKNSLNFVIVRTPCPQKSRGFYYPDLTSWGYNQPILIGAKVMTKNKPFDLQETFNEACALADTAFTYRFVGRERESAEYYAQAKASADLCVDALPDDAPSKPMAIQAAARFAFDAGQMAEALRLVSYGESLPLTERGAAEFGALRLALDRSILN